MKTNQNSALLKRVQTAWNGMANLREKRTRNKNYAYGNQWCDKVLDDNGRPIREYDKLKNAGREPISNNLIRQLVKSIVGRFRYNLSENPDNEKNHNIFSENMLDELDCRAMEEFLISGCCFQKLEKIKENQSYITRITNVNPNRIFLEYGEDARGWDCSMIGEIHDMDIADILLRLANGNRRRALSIRIVLDSERVNMESNFPIETEDNKFRILEVWTRESRECYECLNTKTGEWYLSKTAVKNKDTECKWTIEKVWRCHWMTQSGEVLCQYDSPFKHRSHPYSFKLYPLIDGEVHSLVEDVIDQQKHVNRLITMIDHIMGVSAKGVLFYPDNVLPDGYSWEKLRKAWSRPDSIIPYHPRFKEDKPQQIFSTPSNMGAYEMINLQMKLFEKISGVSGAMQGQSTDSKTGARLYESQVENANVSLCDIFDTFNAFRHQRNEKVLNI